MDQELSNRVAIVTGGTGGLGHAAAVALARQGARIVVADLPSSQPATTIDAIVAVGGEACFEPVDVVDGASVSRLIQATVERWGRLDIAVNNAGVDGVRAKTAEYPEDVWRHVLEVNLTGVWQCMRYEIPAMLEHGAGVIVNVASIAGLLAVPGYAAYAASKHAVIGLTRTAAVEYIRRGIRINALCPGYTQTPMVERLFADRPQLGSRLTDAIPLGRIGTPQEIADAVVYLCSDRTAFMVGHALVLDGGITAM
ncbi:MAG: SDR family oxidoreductase [Herpetosiphon sp.]